MIKKYFISLIFLFYSCDKELTDTQKESNKDLLNEQVLNIIPNGSEKYLSLNSDYIFDQKELRTYDLILPKSSLEEIDSDPVAETGPITSSGNISPYFSNIPFDENSIIRFDPRGNIWITSKQDGIFVLDTNRDYWPNIEGINSSNSSLISNDINDIKFDASLGLAYIATKLGVSKFKIPFASEIDKVDQIDIFPSPFSIP